MRVNLPNMLIVLRIILIPVFLFFFLSSPDSQVPPEAGESAGLLWAVTGGLTAIVYTPFRLAAVAVFLIAAISDYFDGLLARKWNTVSNFGKLMDPLADKMLVSAAMVALASRQELAAWVVIVIICREFWVTSLRMLALEQGKEIISASMWGKIKTVLQMVMLTVLIAGYGTSAVGILLVYMAVFATILSAIEYTRGHKDVFEVKQK